MKLVLITYNIAVNDEVMEMLDALELKSYTRWEQVTGVGTGSGPHLGDHIWPGKNLAMAVVTDDGKARALMDAVGELRKTMRKAGVKAFLIPIDDVTS